MPDMRTDALDYELPPELIATQPATPRDAARLMVIHRQSDNIEHRQARDLPRVLAASRGDGPDLMVMNHTRVVPAAFTGVRTATGGRVQGLYLDSPASQPDQWRCLIESRGKPKPGETITLDENARLTLLAKQGGGHWLAQLISDRPTLAVLDAVGAPPLPPYIRQQRKLAGLPEMTETDRERYNTIFAQTPGSVAAPTASLHFTPSLLRDLDAAQVKRAPLTLHVGMGTFAPVRSDRLEDHPIHQEWMHIPAATIAALKQVRQSRGRIIPIGTTCVRALESLPDAACPAAKKPADFITHTGLFIRPDDPSFAFRFTDALMTNFHLPRSTLLGLVAALPGVGVDRLLSWYRLAVREGYRFYSYGDAMLIL